MTDNLNLLNVKKFINSLDKEKNEKEIKELLSVICQKSTVYDIEAQCSCAVDRVIEGDQLTLKELVNKGYNNVLFKDKNGAEYSYYETGFTEEQLSQVVEVTFVYRDFDGYTIVDAEEVDLKEAKKFVKHLFIPQVHCNRCGGHVLKSLNKNYIYQCLNCNEDLFEFETHAVKDESKSLTNEALTDLAIKAYNLGFGDKES